MAESGKLQNLYPPSARVRSEVWKYFGYKKDAEGMVVEDGFPICKKCGREIAAKHGNTSNMFTHLRRNHPIQFREIMQNYRTRINSPISRARNTAIRRESYKQMRREGRIMVSPGVQNQTSTTDDNEVNSQGQQESVINSASSETDCSSVSPLSSWLKQEPKNEMIEWENMNSEVHTDAETDITLSNVISTSTTQVESLITSEMLTITKLQGQVENKQEKIEALEKQVQDLQEDRKFLRTQIENLTSVLSAYVRDGVNKNQEK
ncbi:uncharacterized protein [Misgurnus anguillicaudatus]|uniref:uncharacterized protein isoform X2 n=1 Tax=Misgurnus anguillicaudatus TaxID=75329 RepID=UPI0024352FDA|nr:uncharacterized protein LOC129426335 isoform X2 [Misgurnus anguillicaudatus]